jgi:hypothetical protein
VEELTARRRIVGQAQVIGHHQAILDLKAGVCVLRVLYVPDEESGGDEQQ